MEEYSLDDPTQLLAAASDYALYAGVQTDTSAKEFLDRFPLPVIINKNQLRFFVDSVLQTKADFPGLESTLVACLERIFNTKYGASLIPQYMPFVQVGLQADSQIVRNLACKTVICLLEHLSEEAVSPVQLLLDYDIYPLLLDCLTNGNEQVASSSMEATKKLAGFPLGLEIIFPANTTDATHLGGLAARSSSLGRVRVLALVVKLFSVSSSVASEIHKMNLLGLFESEINNSSDTLVTLNVLELLYELSEVEHGKEFLSGSTLLILLSSIISNESVGSILRSRAMMISGRLLRDNDVFLGDSSSKTVISAIDKLLDTSETRDTDGCESAIEALGQIGSSNLGAQLLLSSTPPAARHVIDIAFDRQGRGKQLAALHALGNISGETRADDNVILDNNSEDSLRRLIYEKASMTSKLRPFGLVLSVLQQNPEARLAGYRVITGLVPRPWFLMEICSKQDIIDVVTNPRTENTKIGMEARYNCCKAIQRALTSSNKATTDPSLAAVAQKINEAVRIGPYLARKLEAQPTVITADRF